MMRDQRGMTLVEILVALAITALITGTLVTAIYQIYQVTGWGNNQMRVQHDLQNAATWLNRDVVSAYSAHIVSASQMTLTIPYVDSMITDTVNTRVITYTFSAADRTLTRDSDASTAVTVARHIIFSPFPPTTDTITSTITITLTSQAGDVTGSATLHLDMRPEATPTPSPY